MTGFIKGAFLVNKQSSVRVKTWITDNVIQLEILASSN